MRTFILYNINHDHKPTPGHAPGFLLPVNPKTDEDEIVSLGLDWDHFRDAMRGKAEDVKGLSESIGDGCYRTARLDAEGKPVLIDYEEPFDPYYEDE